MILADEVEPAVRRLAGIGPEWVALTVRCIFGGARYDIPSGADLMFEQRDGETGARQYRTVAVDFIAGRVDFDFIMGDAADLSAEEAHSEAIGKRQ